MQIPSKRVRIHLRRTFSLCQPEKIVLYLVKNCKKSATFLVGMAFFIFAAMTGFWNSIEGLGVGGVEILCLATKKTNPGPLSRYGGSTRVSQFGLCQLCTCSSCDIFWHAMNSDYIVASQQNARGNIVGIMSGRYRHLGITHMPKDAAPEKTIYSRKKLTRRERERQRQKERERKSETERERERGRDRVTER